MPDAIIFDIDGTLLDSVDLHPQAWQEALQYFGHDIPLEKIRSQIGKGGDQLLPVFLGKDELEKRQKEIQEFRLSLFKEKYLDRVKPFPCVRELFQKVLDSGQKAALASSAQGDELKHYERIANIEDLVEVETSSADAERSKPHPDIFEAAWRAQRARMRAAKQWRDSLVLRAARLIPRPFCASSSKGLGLKVKPANAIIVGNSPYDAEAARKASVTAVVVLCGGFPEAALWQAGCVDIFDGPADLLRQYDASPLAKRRPARHG